jgi:hypothetical protein
MNPAATWIHSIVAQLDLFPLGTLFIPNVFPLGTLILETNISCHSQVFYTTLFRFFESAKTTCPSVRHRNAFFNARIFTAETDNT